MFVVSSSSYKQSNKPFYSFHLKCSLHSACYDCSFFLTKIRTFLVIVETDYKVLVHFVVKQNEQAFQLFRELCTDININELQVSLNSLSKLLRPRMFQMELYFFFHFFFQDLLVVRNLKGKWTKCIFHMYGALDPSYTMKGATGIKKLMELRKCSMCH